MISDLSVFKFLGEIETLTVDLIKLDDCTMNIEGGIIFDISGNVKTSLIKNVNMKSDIPGESQTFLKINHDITSLTIESISITG